MGGECACVCVCICVCVWVPHGWRSCTPRRGGRQPRMVAAAQHAAPARPRPPPHLPRCQPAVLVSIEEQGARLLAHHGWLAADGGAAGGAALLLLALPLHRRQQLQLVALCLQRQPGHVQLQGAGRGQGGWQRDGMLGSSSGQGGGRAGCGEGEEEGEGRTMRSTHIGSTLREACTAGRQGEAERHGSKRGSSPKGRQRAAPQQWPPLHITERPPAHQA